MGKKDSAAKDQAKRLEEERKRQEKERLRIERENKQKKDAARRRRLGRSSLVKTSELGVEEDLG